MGLDFLVSGFCDANPARSRLIKVDQGSEASVCPERKKTSRFNENALGVKQNTSTRDFYFVAFVSTR
jgi:hypothetical protein